MLPKTLALVDDDLTFTNNLSAYLRNFGVDVTEFADSSDLLACAYPYDFDFYVIDLTLPSVDGIELIKVLRKRTSAGILVVTARLATDTFRQVIEAGADMFLAKPVQIDQIAVAVEAVQRRIGACHPLQNTWRLDRRARHLLAPDGVRIELSDRDLELMECFVEAEGEVVSREILIARLGDGTGQEITGGLNGTIFRLRRRIERVTDTPVPLHAKSGLGYAFRAPLKVI